MLWAWETVILWVVTLTRGDSIARMRSGPRHAWRRAARARRGPHHHVTGPRLDAKHPGIGACQIHQLHDYAASMQGSAPLPRWRRARRVDETLRDEVCVHGNDGERISQLGGAPRRRGRSSGQRGVRDQGEIDVDCGGSSAACVTRPLPAGDDRLRRRILREALPRVSVIAR